MELLHNGLSLDTPARVFPLSTDSMLLADFVRPSGVSSVLDLGSGCGTLGLLLCAKFPACRVTGVELSEDAHRAAEENIRRNGLEDRLASIFGDLRELHNEITPGSFSCCVSNPPYFSGGPTHSQTPLARSAESCSPEELFRAAARALKYGGYFYLVHKPEALAQLCACAASSGLEPKRLRLVRHSPGKEVSLVLLQCRKGAKPGLIWEEICLFDADGNPTQDHRRIYHD